MDYVLGWTIKGGAFLLSTFLIVKLIWISLDKNRMNALEAKLRRHKKTIIIWFVPAAMASFAIAMYLGFYSDELLRSGSVTQFQGLEQETSLSELEQKIACDLPSSKAECE